jgi:hypothetical protein
MTFSLHNSGEKMAKNITVAVSDEIYMKMENHRDVNWSEVCRMAISDYIQTKTSPFVLRFQVEQLRNEVNEIKKRLGIE